MKWWWLSFADAGLPKGTQFLGACVVRGDDMIAAVRESHRLKINPGGGVQGIEIEPFREKLIAPRWRERLLTRDECAAFDAELTPKV